MIHRFAMTQSELRITAQQIELESCRRSHPHCYRKEGAKTQPPSRLQVSNWMPAAHFNGGQGFPFGAAAAAGGFKEAYRDM